MWPQADTNLTRTARLRTALVCVVNSALLVLLLWDILATMTAQTKDPLHGYHVQPPSLEVVIALLLLTGGLVLEVRRSPVAKYVNIGFFVVVAAWAAGAFVAEATGLINADGHSWTFLLFFGIPSMALAYALYRLYRTSAGQS